MRGNAVQIKNAERECVPLRKNYPLWLHVGVIFTVLIVLVSFALGFSSYRMVQRTTRTATIQLAEQI